jgi:hypothetical protein
MDRYVAAGRTAAQRTTYYRLGTTNAGLYGDRLFRAVAGASAAFHAGVTIHNPGKAIVNCQNTVWTDHSTHPAPGASVV